MDRDGRYSWVMWLCVISQYSFNPQFLHHYYHHWFCATCRPLRNYHLHYFGHLQKFALFILVAILLASSFQVAKLLRTVDPLLHILALSASPFHLPHHPSRIVHFKIESKCPFLANMGPHLTGLTYFPGLAARIIILRQKKEISIPLQHRASPYRVYLLSLMIPQSKIFLQKKNKFNSALANIESRPHLTSQGWPTSRYWLHQPSLHLLPFDLLSHHPKWL